MLHVVFEDDDEEFFAQGLEQAVLVPLLDPFMLSIIFGGFTNGWSSSSKKLWQTEQGILHLMWLKNVTWREAQFLYIEKSYGRREKAALPMA